MIGVTGASGFVGRALCEALSHAGFQARPFMRSPSASAEAFVVGDIGPATEWADALKDISCIVHCAAHVHQMHVADDSARSRYHAVNTEGTLRLAQCASDAGVKRLVFLSSVKVMGESSTIDLPFKNSDTPRPTDPYGVSKWEAEQALWRHAKQTGLEVVVVRPPLVYGPGVGANFYQLMKWIDRGIPLPFGSIENRRSLVALPNLISLILKCICVPEANGNTFFVSDGQDLSTPQLVQTLAQAMGRPVRLVPLPTRLLRILGTLSGRSKQAERLLESLQVDIAATRETLNWEPICSVDEGARMAVRSLKTP